MHMFNMSLMTLRSIWICQQILWAKLFHYTWSISAAPSQSTQNAIVKNNLKMAAPSQSIQNPIAKNYLKMAAPTQSIQNAIVKNNLKIAAPSQSIQNPTAKNYLKMAKRKKAVVLTKINSSASEHTKPESQELPKNGKAKKKKLLF